MPTNPSNNGVPAILELPPGLTLDQLQGLMNDRIRDLNAALQQLVGNPSPLQVDLDTNRIINLADPANDLDGVNLRTLKKFVGPSSTPLPPAAKIATPGSAPFVVYRERYSELTINDTSAGSPGSLTAKAFAGPLIDDTDVFWHGVCPVAVDATTDPVGFSPSMVGVSRYPGIGFKVGDYILWPVNGEIDLITGISITGVFTLARHFAGSPVGQAQFGSAMGAHSPGELFYRCADPGDLSAAEQVGMVGATQTASGLPVKHRFTLANDVVLAVSSQAIAEDSLGAVSTVNLFNFQDDPPNVPTIIAPGFRTLAGTEYTLGAPGPLFVGATAYVRKRVRAPETIGCVYGMLTVPGVGAVAGVTVQVWVCYLTPDGMVAGLVDIINFVDGERISWSLTDPPEHRQMPYHSGWQATAYAGYLHYPPTIFPMLPGAVGPDGGLVIPFGGMVQDPSTPVFFEHGGFLDSIVTQVGAQTNSGTVDTSGSTVTLDSGDNFVTDGSWNGQPITINGVIYFISSVSSTSSLTLIGSAGTQSAVSYSYAFVGSILEISVEG